MSFPEYRVSILVLAYRMESTILRAIDGALSQSIPCEVIVSDDASNDNGFEIARRRLQSYSGPHRVLVRRNERNQGLCRHINTVANVATGRILVFMAGDDVSYPNRVQRLLEVFDRHQDAYAVGSAVDEVDVEENIIRRGAWFLADSMVQEDFLRCGKFVTLLGASMAIRRELLDNLPPLAGAVEDNMLTLRASLFGPVYCIKDSLLAYRRHEGNLGSWMYARGSNPRAARRHRYERTIRMYREIADDHERCLTALVDLPAKSRSIGAQIVSMYRIEAAGREAVLNHSKRAWLAPIWAGLKHPGLRRKSFERALKLLIPRRWMGLEKE